MQLSRDMAALTRRRFLQAGAVGVLGFPALLRADEKKDDPFGGFTMGVQSYCFRNFATEPALKRTQELGIKHIEFYSKHAPPGSTPEQIQTVRRIRHQADRLRRAYLHQGSRRQQESLRVW